MQGDISGDIHFDDDENWTLGSYIGVNLTQVSALVFLNLLLLNIVVSNLLLFQTENKIELPNNPKPKQIRVKLIRNVLSISFLECCTSLDMQFFLL